jgi:hypothetical protein
MAKRKDDIGRERHGFFGDMVLAADGDAETMQIDMHDQGQLSISEEEAGEGCRLSHSRPKMKPPLLLVQVPTPGTKRRVLGLLRYVKLDVVIG